ncbi:carboxypeptidase regulatory-like domain-containing protein [Lysobacter cavernae]|uniref:Carboxypeptidase regulatory-like domain-containing protein n=1 Tax=Lysobacter cavernae TaxID=1685901 RepID=A0ABV7RU40_9GAMM
MNSKGLRRTALCIAMGVCLSSALSLQSAHAANDDGSLVGRATAGAEVTVRNPDTGFTRTVRADANGNYRFPFLPVGNYTLQANKDGAPLGQPIEVTVSLGNAANVNVGGDATNLATVQVVGSRVVTPVDVTSTESATNVTREELGRLPVERDVLSVATLAPGVNKGEFGGVSFGGSSVAENTVYINGLNVTDFYNRVGFSSLPFSFFQEFQVKTGGYSVEFGRTTGGVINAVTRSGTNEFQAGADMVFDNLLQAHSSNKPGIISRYDETNKNNNYSVWGSGALIKDRLFFFGIYEKRDLDTTNTNDTGETQFVDSSDNDFWGAKLDWQINDSHLLGLFAFSDKNENVEDSYPFDWTTGNRLDSRENRTFSQSGGDNWALTYTGYLTDTFSMKALYGKNERNSSVNSLNDDACNLVQDRRESSDFIGCTSNTAVIDRTDEREAARLDFEWSLGYHLLRFGADRETNTSDYLSRYPGDGLRYEINRVPGSRRVNGTPVRDGVTAYVRTREVANEGEFETLNTAYYVEDNWSVTPNVVLNLGLRLEAFDNKDAAGNSYIKMDDMLAPRFGFSWDVNGDARTKVFGNLGRYFLPVANVINIKQAGPFLDARRFFEFDGFTTFTNPSTGRAYPAPILGAEIGTVDDTQGNGMVGDLRSEVDADMDPVYQDELILGFQSMLADNWSWGVRGIYRRLNNAIDDMEISDTGYCQGNVDKADGDGYSDAGSYLGFVMGNPGKPTSVYVDTDCDGTPDSYTTIDTSQAGWALYDDAGNYLGQRGWDKPKRTYKALEFVIDRAWDDQWSFNASYTLSYSEGNAEGPVNSDTDFADSGRTEAFDNPFVDFNGVGYLPNDHRHQFKFRGTYAFNENWQVGATLDAQSGRPVSEYGAGNPVDDTEFLSHYICAQNCTEDFAPSERIYRLSRRGHYDRLPWTFDLGASISYHTTIGRSNLNAKLAFYNLLDQERVLEVDETLEDQNGIGTLRPEFGRGTVYQSPRYAQLMVSIDF